MDIYEREQHYASMRIKEYSDMDARLKELEIEKKELEKKMTDRRSTFRVTINFQNKFGG